MLRVYSCTKCIVHPLRKMKPQSLLRELKLSIYNNETEDTQLYMHLTLNIYILCGTTGLTKFSLRRIAAIFSLKVTLLNGGLRVCKAIEIKFSN